MQGIGSTQGYAVCTIHPVQRFLRGPASPLREAGCAQRHDLSPGPVTANRMLTACGWLRSSPTCTSYVHVPSPPHSPGWPPAPAPFPPALTLRSTPWGSLSVSRASRACRYATSSAAYCSCRGDSGRRSQNCSTVRGVWIGLVGEYRDAHGARRCNWCGVTCQLGRQAPQYHRW